VLDLLKYLSSWSDELVWTLISAIESDTDIHDGLFPGVGAIKRSGGTPKTHHYYNLAMICFKDHEIYKDSFGANPEHNEVLLGKQRKLWTEKVGNKIKA
jgi:hypothetical protein